MALKTVGERYFLVFFMLNLEMPLVQVAGKFNKSTIFLVPRGRYRGVVLPPPYMVLGGTKKLSVFVVFECLVSKLFAKILCYFNKFDASIQSGF